MDVGVRFIAASAFFLVMALRSKAGYHRRVLSLAAAAYAIAGFGWLLR